MVRHYKVSGYLAFGSYGEKLPSTTEPARGEVPQLPHFAEARRSARRGRRGSRGRPAPASGLGRQAFV